jgi:hypothetical protein
MFVKFTFITELQIIIIIIIIIIICGSKRDERYDSTGLLSDR